MNKTRQGRPAPGTLVLLGFLLLGLSSSGCRGVSSPALTATTEATNPAVKTVSPATATPPVRATRTAATPPPADPTPTPPPVAPQEGFTAPDFSLPDLQGSAFTLSQFRGRPVLINFWTTWCPYCREEIDALEKTHHRYADQGVVVLAVDVQEKAETVISFAQELDLTLPILLDQDASTVRSYSTMVIPTSFFVDQQGVVSFIHTGPLTEEIIDTYLTDLLDGE